MRTNGSMTRGSSSRFGAIGTTPETREVPPPRPLSCSAASSDSVPTKAWPDVPFALPASRRTLAARACLGIPPPPTMLVSPATQGPPSSPTLRARSGTHHRHVTPIPAQPFLEFIRKLLDDRVQLVVVEEEKVFERACFGRKLREGGVVAGLGLWDGSHGGQRRKGDCC